MTHQQPDEYVRERETDSEIKARTRLIDRTKRHDEILMKIIVVAMARSVNIFDVELASKTAKL
jgi:hypothetical protein